MYRLKVVAGNIKGASFDLREETTIGRQEDNTIVLPSSKISKKHCVLVVNNDNVTLKDSGSSNGTFVNGTLTKSKQLSVGDRIGIGEYLLELRKTPLPAVRSSQSLVLIQGGAGGLASNLEIGKPTESVRPLRPQAPSDLKGKFWFYFDRFVMPIFHSYNLKFEWRSMVGFMLGVALVGNLLVSVSPLLETSDAIVKQEAFRRSQYMARQIANTNGPIFASGDEGKATVLGSLAEDGIREAYVLDLDNRIVAPEDKRNKYLASGFEARAADQVAKRAKRSGDIGSQRSSDGRIVVAIEPIKVFDAQLGKNVVRGLALVSVDTSFVTLDAGAVLIIYSKVLIITGLLMGLIFLIIYRLTLKPLEILNEDLDGALTGKSSDVSRDFKFEELGPLLDVVSSALQRIPRTELDGNVGGADHVSQDALISEVHGAIRSLGESMPTAMAAFDINRRMIALNSKFEDLTGIRADFGMGQEIQVAARDQGFGVFAQDLIQRAEQSGSLTEDFDFGGVAHSVQAQRMGSGQARVVALIAVPKG